MRGPLPNSRTSAHQHTQTVGQRVTGTRNTETRLQTVTERMTTKMHIDIDDDGSPAMLTSSSSSSEEEEDESTILPPGRLQPTATTTIGTRKRYNTLRRKASYDIDDSGTFRANGLMISPGEIPLETLIEMQKKRKYSSDTDHSDTSLTSSTQSSYVTLGTLGSGATATVYSAMHVRILPLTEIAKQK